MTLSCSSGVLTRIPAHDLKIHLPLNHRNIFQCRLGIQYSTYKDGKGSNVPSVSPSGQHMESAFRKRVSRQSQAAARLGSTDVSDQVGEDFGSQFSDIEVVSTSGEPVALPELWASRLVVVAWARHFGCLLCKKRAAEMTKRKADFNRQGAQLVIIGPGSQSQAKAFLEQTGFGGEVYADPTSASFEKLGFVFGASTIFTPKALANLAGASMEGFKQDWGLSLQKDTVIRGGWQQGGVLVAGSGVDNVRFLHKDKEAGDEPDWSEVLRACGSA